nr:LysR family transcriptional regulator [Halovulum dunhuangense]
MRHILGVVAVADQGTLSAAAREINLSQPALTQGVARIEEDLGTSLFRRGGGGMIPTEAGQLFILRARRGVEFLRRGGQVVGRPHLYRMLSVGQLRSLVAAVEHGGFRPAAMRLGREASTISRACREIEHQAGVELFENTSSGLQPTKQANEFMRFAKLAMGEFRQAVHDVRGWQGAPEGRLAIGCLPMAQTHIVPEALNRFSHDYPRIEPRVVDGYYDSLTRGLRRGDLDILLGALRTRDLPEGLVQEALFSDPLVVVARPGHPLDGVAGVDGGALARHPWVAPRAGAPSRRYFDKVLSGLSIPADVPAPVETGSHTVMRGLLFGSDRMAMLSRLQVSRDIGLGLLVQIDHPLPDSARPIGITHREDWLPGMPQARFLEILREVTAAAR